MPSIAITGAGPAGLTLARLLQQADLPSLAITVYEKDASATARFFQGGTLDLHTNTGLAALRAANLWDEFQRHARYEGEELVIGDKNGTVFVHMKSTPQAGKNGAFARPEIDREDLKDMLIDSLHAGTIHWGKHLKKINAQTGILTFADGSEAGPFDLVIGADGAWSRVRRVVTDTKPIYSGVGSIAASITRESAGDRWQCVSKMIGNGSYFTYSDGKALMAQRMSNGSLRFSANCRTDKSWALSVLDSTGNDDKAVQRVLLREFSDWDMSLKQWIELTTGFQAWPFYELPVGGGWEHLPGFTLMGDAAHLMTPFAGEGVNAAMTDALELAEELIKALQNGNSSLDAAVEVYEGKMFQRARHFQADTLRNKEEGFREKNAPIGFLVANIGSAAEQAGYNLDQGLLAWIPVRKIAYCYLWAVSNFGLARRWFRERSGPRNHK